MLGETQQNRQPRNVVLISILSQRGDVFLGSSWQQVVTFILVAVCFLFYVVFLFFPFQSRLTVFKFDMSDMSALTPLSKHEKSGTVAK